MSRSSMKTAALNWVPIKWARSVPRVPTCWKSTAIIQKYRFRNTIPLIIQFFLFLFDFLTLIWFNLLFNHFIYCVITIFHYLIYYWIIELNYYWIFIELNWLFNFYLIILFNYLIFIQLNLLFIFYLIILFTVLLQYFIILFIILSFSFYWIKFINKLFYFHFIQFLFNHFIYCIITIFYYFINDFII